MENLAPLAEEAKAKIAAAEDGQTLEQLRVDYLGKKGQITGLLKGLGKAPCLNVALPSCILPRAHSSST